MHTPVRNIVGKNINEAKKLLNEYTIQILNDNDPYFLDDEVTKYEVNEKKETIILYVNKREKSLMKLDEKISYLNNLGFVTGRNSNNKDLFKKRNIGSTDLGICVDNNENILYLYGDTFSGIDCNKGEWNSNFLAISSNKEFSRNITFLDIISLPNGSVKPIIQGQHDKNEEINLDLTKNREVTKIPTGGIRINNDVYIFYMSVYYWGKPGEWFVRNNQCLKSNAYDLFNFEQVKNLNFDNSINKQFGQIYPFKNPFDSENIYFLALPGGRFGNTVLLRVRKENFENKNHYEILTLNKSFKKISNTKINEYFYIVNGNNSSEQSIVYNNYLKKWVISNLCNDGIYLYTSDDLFAEFKKDIKVLNFATFPLLYGGFIHPKMIDRNGKRMYMQVSQWSPIYNTSLFEIVFK